MSDIINLKKMVAESAVKYIQDGMIVGLGSGSTAYWAIKKIGQRVKDGLKIRAIATSIESESLAQELEIPIANLSDLDRIDITIDGADEIDSDLNLIKGGGGALLREKIVATASDQFIVVADETKMVKQLGRFPLPVEVIPFAVSITRNHIEKLGCKTEIRMSNDKNRFQTDNGNLILDCKFESINNPEQLNRMINTIPGVVEHGLFINLAHKVLVGFKNEKSDTLEIIEY